MSKLTKWLKCKLLGHKFVKVQALSEQSDREYCTCCGMDLAINYGVRLAMPMADARHFYEERGVKIVDISAWRGLSENPSAPKEAV